MMNQRNLNLVTAAGVIVALLAVIFIALLPLGRRFQNLRGEISQNKLRIAELVERESRLQKFLRQKDEIEALTLRARAYLPDSPDTARYIRELEGISESSKAGVSAATFQPERKEKGSELGTIPVAISGDGDFSAILSLLSALETNIRFSAIESVQLTGFEGGAVSARLEGTLFTKPLKKLGEDLKGLVLDPKVKTKLLELTSFALPFDEEKLKSPGRSNPFLEL